MYVHYDNETDGLNVSGQPSDHPDQPGIVSLSAVLDDIDGNTLDSFSTLIKPIRLIAPEAIAIHGITTERAEAEGIPHHEAMRMFEALAQRATILSAFNHFFDFKMLKIGCARMPEGGEQLRKFLESKSAICTMDSARKYLQAGRFIKLHVAHERLIGSTFEKAHESMADTQAHRRVFYHLKNLNALVEPKPLTAKVYSTPLLRTPAQAAQDENPAPTMQERQTGESGVAPVRKRPGAVG